jgi:predicted XRE-type DNA-binding protein
VRLVFCQVVAPCPEPGPKLARRHITRHQGYTQVETAKRPGMTQPRVSALLKGTWKDFSMDMLLTLATRAGLKPELHLAPTEKGRAA